jgi:DnaJ-class molecular chaperone
MCTYSHPTAVNPPEYYFETKPCDLCDGSGEVECLDRKGHYIGERECPYCEGTGEVDYCTKCGKTYYKGGE